MRIDADQMLTDFRGNAMQLEDRDCTLGDIIANGCLQPQQEDAQKPGQSLRAYKMAQKFAQGGWVEIDTEDASFIKSRLEKISSPLVIGRVYEMLDESLSSK